MKSHDIRNGNHRSSMESNKGSVRCFVFDKSFKIHESGGDCHGILFPHQPADTLPVPEKIREPGPLAAYIVVGDAQVVSIFMLSGKNVEIGPMSLDLCLILSCFSCFGQADLSIPCLAACFIFLGCMCIS